MSGVKPFLFDQQSFDHDDIPTLSQEKEEMERKKLRYSNEQLEQATADAYSEGEEAGRQAALAMIEAQLHDMMAGFPQALADLEQRDAQRLDDIRNEAVAVAIKIVQKILPHVMERHALEDVSGFIEKALAERFDEARLVIRVAPSILDPLKARMAKLVHDSGFTGKYILMAEGTLTQADCRLEWADGGAERDTGRLMQDIDQMIQHFLSMSSPAASKSSFASQTIAATEEAPALTPEAEAVPEDNNLSTTESMEPVNE